MCEGCTSIHPVSGMQILCSIWIYLQPELKALDTFCWMQEHAESSEASRIPRLYSYQEVSEMLGLSVSRLRQLTTQGELEASVQDQRVRRGRRYVRFSEEDIRRFLQRRGARLEPVAGEASETATGSANS
jgi:excisionase family DNA binding protein